MAEAARDIQAGDLVAYRDFQSLQVHLGIVASLMVETKGGDPLWLDLQDFGFIDLAQERIVRRLPVASVVGVWRQHRA